MSQGEESGYDSPGSTTPYSPEIYFSSPHLKHLNEQLQTLEPEGMFFFHYELPVSGFTLI